MMISIVLNLLNEKRHIRDLLDSLVTQEKPFVIIIVDAGSWDGTVDVIKKYMDAHPEIELYHKPGTRGESTNFGIMNAKGDAIATIGGDCIANPFWLKELRKTLKEKDIAAGRTISSTIGVWTSRIPAATWPGSGRYWMMSWGSTHGS